MSKIEVNQIDTISGSSTLLVGPSAATKLTFSSTLTVDFNVNSPGVTLGSTMKNQGAFFATSAATSIGSGAYVKVIYSNETIDVDGWYDSSTNYRYTPQSAGKYYIAASCNLQPHLSTINPVLYMQIRKNGSTIGPLPHNLMGSSFYTSGWVQGIVDMNGSTDYIEIYMSQNSGLTRSAGDTGYGYFLGYKLIG